MKVNTIKQCGSGAYRICYYAKYSRDKNIENGPLEDEAEIEVR